MIYDTGRRYILAKMGCLLTHVADGRGILHSQDVYTSGDVCELEIYVQVSLLDCSMVGISTRRILILAKFKIQPYTQA